MSYAFDFETGGGSDTSFAMNISEMSIMRELMREVGAVLDPATQHAMEDGPGVAPGCASIAKFKSNDGQLVTPDECRIIATRLEEHLPIVREVASFFDDAPMGKGLDAWVRAWADYNARAAAAGGFRVR